MHPVLARRFQAGIVINWGKDGHSKKWRQLISRQYPYEIGGFVKEHTIETSKGIFHILVFERAAMAIKDIGENTGVVEYFGYLNTKGPGYSKSSRFKLYTDHTIRTGKESGTAFVLRKLPETVKSVKQMLDWMPYEEEGDHFESYRPKLVKVTGKDSLYFLDTNPDVLIAYAPKYSKIKGLDMSEYKSWVVVGPSFMFRSGYESEGIVIDGTMDSEFRSKAQAYDYAVDAVSRL